MTQTLIQAAGFMLGLGVLAVLGVLLAATLYNMVSLEKIHRLLWETLKDQRDLDARLNAAVSPASFVDAEEGR